ncbi:MAG: DUF4412 domain-containing protein [Bacteroidota bacterium]
MKKLLTLAVLLFVVFQSRSQGFEGTLKWSMKMDITDPKAKADMEKANQQMADPKTQAQMKELEAKMNDPEFKKMMDSNPQMKAQMETMLKSLQGAAGPGGGGVNSMVPSGMTMKLKGASTLMTMNGGMMGDMEILYQADKNQSAKLDRKNKTYSILPSGPQGGDPGKAKMPDVKFTKTSETTKILGYNCTKYTAEIKEHNETITQTFWTTSEIKDIDLKALSSQRIGQGGRAMLPSGVEGVPMRIESIVPQGKMIMEVTEIKKESLPASDFTIPSDFKEVKMAMGRP